MCFNREYREETRLSIAISIQKLLSEGDPTTTLGSKATSIPPHWIGFRG